jgi:hypothetical protein
MERDGVPIDHRTTGQRKACVSRPIGRIWRSLGACHRPGGIRIDHRGFSPSMHLDRGSIKPKRQEGVPAGTNVDTRPEADNEAAQAFPSTMSPE